MGYILQGSKTGRLTSPVIAVQDLCIKIISLGSLSSWPFQEPQHNVRLRPQCRIIVVGGKLDPVL
ncbi:hypothetical protein A2U01_0003985 [Trifolium medium]|uniref:Uncharacterized protein n=1 Tax=Trifolium medium TaxID=97028 RepID=A0A392M8Q5_9FABA|nr:hypothetical protein [Trifolium medium]